MAETLHAHQRLSSQEFAYQRAWRRGRPAERFVDKRSFSANPRNNRRGWVLECASLSECTNAPLTAHGCLQGSSDCIRRRSSKQGWETFNNLLYLGKVQVTRKRYSMSQRMRHLIPRNRMVGSVRMPYSKAKWGESRRTRFLCEQASLILRSSYFGKCRDSIEKYRSCPIQPQINAL